MEDNRAWLDGLNPGDEVAYLPAGHGQDYERVRVMRRTGTRIFLSRHGREEWIHAHNGWGPRVRGGGFGVPARIYPMTPEIREAIERRGLLSFLHSMKWSEQTTETLCAVRRILREAAKAPPGEEGA